MQEVEGKIRDRARRFAREEAERKARAHVVRHFSRSLVNSDALILCPFSQAKRSRELREMRERRAREAAERKVLSETKAREDSEKRAKVERARMMEVEAKRKTKDEMTKKAQLQAVARRVEMEQLRIQQEEEKQMEQLKAIEATEKRLREKVERKERRMREDAERRMELERQARVAAEQRVRQLEELQAKEISKRQQAEVAFRRQQREHEDTTRKFDASSKKIEQLEAHLSSLRLKGEMGDTAQGSRRDGTNQVKLPSIQAPSEQESELLRSSYYVRHLKNLASREIMRGMEEDSSRPAQPSTADPHELESASANTNTTAAQGSPALVPSRLNGDGGVVGASSPEQVGAASHRVESLFVCT